MNIRKVPETPLTCEVRAALEEYTQRLMNLYPERFTESDPEAWREECLKKQAAGVWFKVFYEEINVWIAQSNLKFTGKKEHYREAQEAPKVKESDVQMTKERMRELFIASGFELIEEHVDDMFKTYVLVEAMIESAKKDDVMISEASRAEPHAAERALWKAQREAGTNEVWQEILPSGTIRDIVGPPAWAPRCTYRVKPMKLTARILRNDYSREPRLIQDWEFTGTREEYRAECEKYGYAVVSEIKEVVEKPKTVKHYFCLYKTRCGHISTIDGPSEKWVNEWVEDNGKTIIGNIEEREV